MHKINGVLKRFFALASTVLVVNTSVVLANEFIYDELDHYVANAQVNFRTEGSAKADVISTIDRGTEVTVKDYIADGWSLVVMEDETGYVKSEFLSTPEEYENLPEIELADWSFAKKVFTPGLDAEVYDIGTGLTYYVRSFANGNHADVEPVAVEDTNIMLETYGGKWSWDPRPVLVTVSGRTMVASINGMPHGGGVNNNNGMKGQVCIHFKGSTTHNGNKSFAVQHQVAIDEAWDYAQQSDMKIN